MSKSSPFFLSSSSLRMMGTRNDPLDGGANPPAPDRFTCDQAGEDPSTPDDRIAPAPKAWTLPSRKPRLDHFVGSTTRIPPKQPDVLDKPTLRRAVKPVLWTFT